jgi:hypothetical protein
MAETGPQVLKVVSYGFNTGAKEMSSSVLDRCGELLMHKVRGRAVDQWSRILSGTMRDQESRELFESLDPDQRAIVNDLVPRIVDTVMHFSLCLFSSEHGLRLAVQDEKEHLIDVAALSDGLPGELYTEEGWISRFATGTLHSD